ncbi:MULTISPECIES: hypothetical protein [unclassified Helicobacter]|uniref:hypothetical protein n=1 Tax=unclassified Helicobacter TaxID=2593540 RepID=UPI0012E9428B|nr:MULTISPECIES: hypothetical protein [unclassified Helicobacter]
MAGRGALDSSARVDSSAKSTFALDFGARVGAIGKSLDSALRIDSSAESKRGFWIKLLG